MKVPLAFVALLPALGAASCLAERGQGKLPTVDILSLSPDHTTIDTDTDVSALSCPADYPWLCDGRCCPYNIRCTLSCCSPDTDFCSNGLCYKYI
ncbi:hypothetical protein HD806DRAFT_521194 [Xylariaceae sp. AK1471]|nr:hypothetical protein HD806DRAFT_521194 [Xylariaceae sp. AK1471]